MNYKKHIVSWACFALVFLFGWRNYQIFTHIPAYGDALEVVWGISWYPYAIEQANSPFLYPYIFHPEGWQVGILAHTPLLFLLAQPFHWLGGKVFAYNVLAIIPFLISYIGVLRFSRHYTKSHFVQIVLALAFTFVEMRSSRVYGHLHILWATSFLPLAADQILLWRDCEEESLWHKHVWLSGLYAGLTVAFSLYSLFLTPFLFLLLERKLLRWPKVLLQGLGVITVTLLIASTAIVPYLFAIQAEPTTPPGIHQLVFWSANINGLFIPSVNHPISFFQDVGRFFMQTSTGGEARSANLGLSTLPLLLVGLYGLRKQRSAYAIVLIFLIPFTLSLGPLLKISSDLAQWAPMAPINETLWSWAHQFKPDTFDTEVIPPTFKEAIPLPGYFFYAFVPFAESARTVARFSMLTLLGCIGLIGVASDYLPSWLKYTLLVLLAVEMLPNPFAGVYLPTDNFHPAHQWLMENGAEDEAIVDFRGRLYHGPLPLYMSLELERPTAASIGSFHTPASLLLLQQTTDFVNKDAAHMARLFRSYDIEYLVIHQDRDAGKNTWLHIQDYPDIFPTIGCFSPDESHESPWAYDICIARIAEHPTIANVYPNYGFSEPFELWGVWTIEPQPRFEFVATSSTSQVVVLEAFPHCVEDQNQSLRLFAGDELLYEYDWSDCEPVYAEVIVPAEFVEVGWNELRFDFAYALNPVELGTSNDPRTLSVAFNQLQVKPID